MLVTIESSFILRRRIEEAVEGGEYIFGGNAVLTFISIGEISPSFPGAKCELHNQTMTITTFSEVWAWIKNIIT